MYDFYIKLIKPLILGGFILNTMFSFSQIFEGKIIDVDGNIVRDGYITLIDKKDNLLIDYIALNDKGEYRINVKSIGLLRVELSYQGLQFKKKSIIINIIYDKKNYYNDFVVDENIELLDQVILVAKKEKIRIKNDTTVYNISKFKKVGDKKIIDILKKLPGITVNDNTGQISYKGKPIESLLLDGDDLFGKAYSVASRNISSDLIESVEGIEDYHKNRLKKGLSKSNKVAINLKIKKGKIKLSGELSLAKGVERHLINNSIVNLAKRNKGFGIININNISDDNTSFKDEVYNSENAEEIKLYSTNFYKSSRVLDSPITEREYINNLKYISYNNLLRPIKNIKILTNFSFLHDKNISENQSHEEYRLNNFPVKISNSNINNVKTNDFIISNKIEFDISQTSIIQYQSKIRYKNKFYNNNNNILNTFTTSNTDLLKRKEYSENNLTYSKKPSENSLFEVRLKLTNDRLNDSTFFDSNNVDLAMFSEKIISNRRFYNFDVSYIKKRKNINYRIGLSHLNDLEKSKFNDNVLRRNIILNKINEVSTKVNFSGFKKIIFSTDTKFKIIHKTINIEKGNSFALDYFLKLNYKISTSSKASLSYKKTNELPNNYFLNTSIIQPDNQTTIKNIPSNKMINLKNLSIFLFNYDLINQRSYTFLLSYKEKKNEFSPIYEINNTQKKITYFQNNKTLKNLNLSLSTSFFLNKLNNKIELGLSSDQSSYYSFLTNNTPNKIKSSTYSSNIQINSAFDSFFNYKTHFGITKSGYKFAEETMTFNDQLNFGVKMSFILFKKSYIKFNNEFIFTPNNKINYKHLFSDVFFNIKTTKKLEIYGIGKNILNNKYIAQRDINEFTVNNWSRKTHGRYLLIGLNYMF